MKNISIPKPCSENWNEMSPTEKGAFCQKCAIDVYDFTNKSGDEIRDILKLNLGSRVCGRIEPKQLDELNDDFAAWRMSNKQSFNRAWIFSLLVVFGLTLFSCEDDEVSVVKEIQRTAQAFLSQTSELVSSDEFKSVKYPDSRLIEEVGMTGEFHVENPPETLPPPEYIEILGEVDISEEIPEQIVQVEEVAIRGEVEYTEYIAGAMVMVSPYEEHLAEISPESCEVLELSGITYPNPAQNQTTLKVTIPNDGTAEIQLFSMNGQRIRSIHSGRVSKGESQYPVDISDLETGAYLFVIYHEGEKKTVKFSKI